MILRIKIKNIYRRIVTKILTRIRQYKYLTIQIDITNFCNLKCTHCYHSNHSNKGAIQLSDWFFILEQCQVLLQKLYLKPSFVICGGEPLTSPLLVPILKKLNEKWHYPPVSILTNGTIHNKRLIDELKKYRVRFQVSLDGSNSTSHDKKRGKDSFKRTMRGIEILTKNSFKVSLLSILSYETSFDIEEFFKLAKRLNVESMNFTRFIPEGDGKTLQESKVDRSLHPLELKKAFIDIINFSIKHNIKTNTSMPLYHLIDSNLGGHAKFGFDGIIIDFKGNLKVSSRTNFIIKNLVKNHDINLLSNIYLNHPIFQKLRRGEINECGDCIYYAKCGGDRNVSFASYGNYFEKDPGCWKDIT